ncbi:hypothetical protein LHJ74_14635 [Streptomyces sp. N2-109]|uniref:Zinc ribbon domain-containing protein n=1 Tax=Streptomyces gossypii TaxID=2883101 RepID=A0ABT2JUV2_9ACTN|nr:hypothetical protein [Streptomyces gossypii]MCT2591130.1 hypothetical protein [Streptomyces gossypii]
MPYRYECNACNIRGEVSSWRGPARTAQDEHRTQAHAGMQPTAGDRVRHVTPGVLGPATVIVVLLLCVLVETVTGIAPDDVARWIGIL